MTTASPSLRPKEVTVELGRLWNELGEEEKAPYVSEYTKLWKEFKLPKASVKSKKKTDVLDEKEGDDMEERGDGSLEGLDVEVNLDAGNMVVNRVAGDADVNTDAGNLEVNMETGNMEVNMEAGNLEVNVEAGDAEVNMDAANLEVNKDTGNLELKLEAGDVNMEAIVQEAGDEAEEEDIDQIE